MVARGNATRALRARIRADRPRYPGRTCSTLGPRPARANHSGSASGTPGVVGRAGMVARQQIRGGVWPGEGPRVGAVGL